MPTFDPAAWNDGDRIQHRNNCYDYARDRRTGRFSQPGSGHGIWLRDTPYECRQLTDAVRRDGLVPSDERTLCPQGSWKVALVVDPDPTPRVSDFHFYRQDDDGRWSHREGEDPACDVDGRRRAILDPRTADRDGYTTFCGYYCANPRLPPEVEEEVTGPQQPLVQLLLFSGRPNPSRELTEEQLLEVRSRMQGLTPRADIAEGELGSYSGCVVSFNPDAPGPRSVRAFAGAVAVTEESGRLALYNDDERLETFLLELFAETDDWETLLLRIRRSRDPGDAARALIEPESS